jgi:hypothetical protein
MVVWLLRSAQSIIFSVHTIRLNHPAPDRKQTDLIARIDSGNRSTSPPMGLRGHLSA